MTCANSSTTESGLTCQHEGEGRTGVSECISLTVFTAFHLPPRLQPRTNAPPTPVRSASIVDSSSRTWPRTRPSDDVHCEKREQSISKHPDKNYSDDDQKELLTVPNPPTRTAQSRRAHTRTQQPPHQPNHQSDPETIARQPENDVLPVCSEASRLQQVSNDGQLCPPTDTTPTHLIEINHPHLQPIQQSLFPLPHQLHPFHPTLTLIPIRKPNCLIQQVTLAKQWDCSYTR